jgi:hypothetical protein
VNQTVPVLLPLAVESPQRLAAVAVLGAGLLALCAAAGWVYAWWAFRRTNLSPWVAYRAAGVAVGLMLAAMVAAAAFSAPGVTLLPLPLLFATVMAAMQGRRFRGSALGAAGELRQYEQARVGLRAFLAQRSTRAADHASGNREYIATQGQLVRERALTIPTVALDAAGKLLVAAGRGLHIFIVGRTGRGKTRTMERIMYHRAVSQGTGLLVLDGKPDLELPGFLARVAEETGRPFYVVSRKSGVAYNPLAGKDPSEAAEIAVAGLPDDGPSWYRLGALNHFDLVAKVLHAKFGELNLPLLVAASPISAVSALLHWSKGTDLHERVRDHVDTINRSKAMQEVVHGAHLKLSTVVQRGWERTFAPVGDEGLALSLRDALREKAIVLVQCVSASGRQDVETVVAMLLADLNQACTTLDGRAVSEGGAGDDWLAVLDEFSGYVSEQGMEQLVGLYQRTRSAGGQILMGTQSVADLQAFTENESMTDALAENVATLVAHAQQTSSSREWVSMYGGTIEVWSHTDRTTGHGIQTEGSGSARRAREFRIRPDDLAGLDIGEVFVVTPPAAPARGQVDLVEYEPKLIDHDTHDYDPVALVPSGPATLSQAAGRTGRPADDDDGMEAPEGYAAADEFAGLDDGPEGGPEDEDDDVPAEAFDPDGEPEVEAPADDGFAVALADDDAAPADAESVRESLVQVSETTDPSGDKPSVASHTAKGVNRPLVLGGEIEY